jgi:hypothetical protein
MQNVLSTKFGLRVQIQLSQSHQLAAPFSTVITIVLRWQPMPMITVCFRRLAFAPIASFETDLLEP